MKKEQIEELIANFIQTSLDECKKKFKKLDKKRNKFVREFNLSRIQNMKIDEYVEGKKSKETFCYNLERELKALGSIGGGYAKKFAIYYSKEENKYIYAKKYGISSTNAFEKIRGGIINLLKEGKNQNIKALDDIDLPEMLKGKILSTYYPNLYLNVFSKDYLIHYIIKLNLDTDSNNIKRKSLVELREMLVRFKNNNKYTKEWSVFEFGVFLNDYVGHPDKKILPPDLSQYTEINFPLIEDVNPTQINLKINEILKSKDGDKTNSEGLKKNFKKGRKNAKSIGDRGEDIVKKYEKAKLSKANKNDLAQKVDRVSEKSDSYGYDILSFEINGMEKQIEVKATIADPGKAFFVMTENELKKSKKLPNYYLYIVFNANKINPGIWELKNPFIYNASKIKIEPKSYYVSINSSVR